MKKIQYRGKEQSLGKWCKELGLNYMKTYQRINTLGYSIEEAFEKGTDVGKKKKVMIINDVHIPFQHEGLLNEIEKHKDIDYLVVGGDYIDTESCSSFPMLERPTLEQELIAAYEYTKKIKDITKAEIYCIVGNHEERLEREITKMQQKGIQRMIDPQLLRMLSDGFSFYINGKKITYDKIEGFNYIHKWYTKLFDNLIVCHPKNFSNVPGSVAEKAAEHFLNKGVYEKGDIISVSHTHKYSNLICSRRQDAFVIENGCSCKAMDYADRGNLSYGTQVNCYTILEFTEGEKINYNDIKIYFY